LLVTLQYINDARSHERKKKVSNNQQLNRDDNFSPYPANVENMVSS